MKKQILQDFKRLKILLIIATIIQISYLVILITTHDFFETINNEYSIDKIISIISYTIIAILLWYEWKIIISEKKEKISNTFMLLFLGIIGMWLWYPNKRELDKIAEDITAKHNKD
ncbi:hypothetical protein SAMN05444281_1041 [Wenyingzhuangia marina]|uniref:Uncharacterized protein n=1 Tax=Wenyingzhuangia marina TaxID=1195760 RepID=A0A1M5U5A5_9FLAO|nr:hypothetical protein GCM10011397_10560 [Wenyingzhuangia marina]SHH58144.1 hypothetical protein SAMN05444281_1041 [Wenyingzhuangia marina]